MTWCGVIVCDVILEEFADGGDFLFLVIALAMIFAMTNFVFSVGWIPSAPSFPY